MGLSIVFHNLHVTKIIFLENRKLCSRNDAHQSFSSYCTTFVLSTTTCLSLKQKCDHFCRCRFQMAVADGGFVYPDVSPLHKILHVTSSVTVEGSCGLVGAATQLASATSAVAWMIFLLALLPRSLASALEQIMCLTFGDVGREGEQVAQLIFGEVELLRLLLDFLYESPAQALLGYLPLKDLLLDRARGDQAVGMHRASLAVTPHTSHGYNKTAMLGDASKRLRSSVIVYLVCHELDSSPCRRGGSLRRRSSSGLTQTYACACDI